MDFKSHYADQAEAITAARMAGANRVLRLGKRAVALWEDGTALLLQGRPTDCFWTRMAEVPEEAPTPEPEEAVA